MATRKQIDTQLVIAINGMNSVIETLRIAFDLFESNNDDDFYALPESSDMRAAIDKLYATIGIVDVHLSEKMYAKLEKEGVIMK